MKLILRVLSGKKYGQRIVVDNGQSATVGRSTGAKHNFDDDHMSSIHFEVENFGDHAEVRDLKSTNRTWLNNNHVSSAMLKHGDRLRAGKTIMEIEIDHSAVLEESGLSPKPTLLESTNQIAINPSKFDADTPPPTKGPPSEVRPSQVIPGEVAPNEVKPSEVKPSEVRPPESRPGDLRPSELRPSDFRPHEVRPNDVRSGEVPVAQLGDGKPASQFVAARPVVAPPKIHEPPADILPPVSPATPSPFVPHNSTASPNGSGGLKSHVPMSGFVSTPPVDASISSSAPPRSKFSTGDSSPIDSGIDILASGPRPMHSERSNNNPIVESSSIFYSPQVQSLGDKRRFRQYERIGDFQTVYNLRQVIKALNVRKTLRIVCHFAKIRGAAPALTEMVPLYPDLPGASTHLPVSMTYRDWESEPVQSVALRLCGNDALIVFIGEFNAPLDEALAAVGAAGVPGFCEPGGFFGWCWPSAFLSMIQMHGTRRWGELLGPHIEGAIMYSPLHGEVLLAFAAESLDPDLRSLGFNTVR